MKRIRTRGDDDVTMPNSACIKELAIGCQSLNLKKHLMMIALLAPMQMLLNFLKILVAISFQIMARLANKLLS